jgi:hypothetical protein
MRLAQAGFAFAAVVSATLTFIGERDSIAPAARAAAPAATKHVLVRLFNNGSDCDHQVVQDEDPIKLDVSNMDIVHWRIVNDCTVRPRQPILLCVYRKTDHTLYDPFNRCNPHDIGQVFPVASGQQAVTNCVGRQDGLYDKQVLTGSDITGTHCPPTPIPERESKPGKRAHIVDIAIEP